MFHTLRIMLALPLCLVWLTAARAQESSIRYGRSVSPSVRIITKKGLEYLKATQKTEGDWDGGPGITGICVMSMLAAGDDPDFGPYADNIRRGLRNIIGHQDASTGHIRGPGHGPMYHHGFAMLALAEAYGVVNEQQLWQGTGIPEKSQRSVGKALELAVRCAITAQDQNPWKAWRYSPMSHDADTTVSGTVLMGILGARNAGIEVPNQVVDNAIGFFQANTTADGNVSYQPANSHGSGLTRTAIGTLVYAIAKRKDTNEYRLAAESIKRRMDQDVSDHPFYYRYYMAQALFHSDIEAWEVWNERVTQQIQKLQQGDGSIESSHGRAYGTGMSLLALGLNYRFLPIYER